MRGPPAPAPPAAAPSSSSRLLPRTVLPVTGHPAHACPASLLGDGPASLAGPRRPRGPRRPPRGTQVLLLQEGREKKCSHSDEETGTPKPRGQLWEQRPPTGLGQLGRRGPLSGLRSQRSSPAPRPNESPSSVWSSPPQRPRSPSPPSGPSGARSPLLPRVQLFYGPPRSPRSKRQREEVGGLGTSGIPTAAMNFPQDWPPPRPLS